MDEKLRFRLAILGFLALVFLISPLAPALFGYLGHAMGYSKVETALMQTVAEENTLTCQGAVSEMSGFGFIGLLSLPGLCVDYGGLIQSACMLYGNIGYIISASCLALAFYVYKLPKKAE